METRITNLKNDFNNITLIRNKIIRVFEILQNKMDKIKIIYSEFIKNSKGDLFIFGLDSFHFQSKLIDLEHDDMKRMFLAINNRMYCEYFKLYKIVVSYIIENISDKKILEIVKGNNFPVYKDLEPFKDYNFEKIMEIHDNILILLNSIISIINDRENQLTLHKNNQLIGLNIDNFVNSFNFEIIIMKEKINLFLTYIEFFQKLHEKYLNRFSNKIVLMLNNINSDIHFDDNIESNANKNNDEITEHSPIINNKIIGVIDSMESFNIEENILTRPNTPSRPNTPTSVSVKSVHSNYSYKSNQSTNSTFKMPKIPKIIKNGIKKVNEIFTGCNIKQIDNSFASNNETIDLISFDDVYQEQEIKTNGNINLMLSLYVDENPENNSYSENYENEKNFENIELNIDDKQNTTELKSESEYSEITNCDSETNKSIVKSEVNDIDINYEIKQEMPKKRRKYKPRKNKV